MTVVHIQKHHFSGAYAQAAPMETHRPYSPVNKEVSSPDAGVGPFPLRTGFNNQAPDCKRVDSGYYSGGGMRSPSVRTEMPTLAQRSSSLQQPTPGPVLNVLAPYKMSIVSTPPIASGHEAQDLFGHSAPEPSSFIHHQSVSEREFATNPLHPRFLANYSVKAELGFGATGFVVAAKRIEDGKPVAVKFMYKDRIPVTHWLRDRQLGGTVPLEIFILKRIDHQHIVKFLDFFEDKKFFYLVMETHGIPALLHNHDGGPSFRTSPLSPTTPTTLRLTTHHSTLLLRRPPRRHSQDLFECIEQNPCMAESDIHHIFRQITSAVAYLHAHNIVHRDIKDENIVIDESLTVKLIDFGNAAYIPRNDSDYFDRFYGTMHCAAPEILRGERYRGPEQDVWCLGVLLYTLAFNQTPFRDARDIATGRWTKPIFDRSELLFRVLKMCLEVDIKKRATITEVLESEWVAGCTTRVA